MTQIEIDKLATEIYDDFLNSDYGQRVWDQACKLYPNYNTIVHEDCEDAAGHILGEIEDCYIDENECPSGFTPFRRITIDEWNNGAEDFKYVNLRSAVRENIMSGLS